MQNRTWLSLLLGFGLTLAGCAQLSEVASRYEQMNLTPVAVGTRDHLDYDYGGVVCGPRTRGLATTIPEPNSSAGQVLLGYDGFDDRGTEPLPCWEYALHNFSGAVLFDVSAVPREGANHLLVATMTARRRATPQANNADCERSFRGIERATEEWDPGYATGRFASLRNPIFCRAGDDPDTLRCNLNNIVRQWIVGERPNHGVVLLPAAYGGLDAEIYWENPRCAHYYDDFRLDVQFVRSP